MGSSFGGFINSVTDPDFRTFGVARNLFIPWDMSEGPKNNKDKVKKLGSGDGSHAMAFREFDHDKKRLGLADGYTGEKPTEISSFALFDPASWVLRMHEKEGKGKDNNWAGRWQTDHGKKAQERGHRSTIFVDNCDDQHWAWSQDLTWVINLKTDVDHDEIKFDKAGFLPQLKTKGAKGESTRGALALNISKRGGFVTDGKKYGSLWHVLNLQSASTGGGSTTGGGGSGGTTVSGTCGEVTEGNLALRGDVLFDTADGLAPLAIKGKLEPTGGKVLTGHHWVHLPVPSKPTKEVSDDGSSNHAIQTKTNPNGLWVFVLDDDLPGMPPELHDVAAGYPSIPGSTGAASTQVRGVFSCKRFADNSNPTGVSSVIPIPEEVTANPSWGITLDANFVTPSGALTSTVDLQVDYCTMAVGDDASPASRTGTLAQTINAATHAGSEVVQRVLFHVPNSDLQGKGGGKLSFAFYRRADTDGDADDFDLINIAVHYGPEITAAGR